MVLRYFTPEEANALLAAVRPLAERMVAHRRELMRAMERRELLGRAIAGNGGALRAGELSELEETIASETRGLARCIDGIHELGAQVKDVDAGLVDFPARMNGEEVLLCWRLGEDEIRYWHRLEEGFAGRRELPF